MFWSTGSGVAILVMETSACPAATTTDEADAELLVEMGSLVMVELAAGLLEMMVPAASVAVTFTTSGKLLTAFAAKVTAVQVMVPVAPTAGVTQTQPVG